VQDWLYGITKTQPQVDKKSRSQIASSTFEAETLLAVYHLVNGSKHDGGAGITPGYGEWENVTSIFPIQYEFEKLLIIFMKGSLGSSLFLPPLIIIILFLFSFLGDC
jgi:hypothetical protein